MKKLAPIILTAVFVSGCGAGIKTVIRGEFNPSGRVAVMPFSGKDGDTGLSLSETFTTYLMDAGFDVMERAQLENVLEEQKISLSGIMAPEAIAEVGKLAGVGAVVTGSYRMRRDEVRTVTPRVAAMAPSSRPLRHPQPGIRQTPGDVRVEIRTVFSGLTVKFVDVHTGRVLLSSSSETEYDADSVNKALSAMAKSIKKKLDEKTK